MKTIAAKLLASVSFALLLSPSLLATDYRYTKITAPDGSPTFVRGINARGDIIGTYTDAGGVDHNFLLHNGVFANIDYPADSDIIARGINARGDIVGSLNDSSGGHGFLLRDGTFTKIDYPAADATTAFGINNAGDITGKFDTPLGEFGYILSQGVFRSVHIKAGIVPGVWGAEDNGSVLTGDVELKSDFSVHAYLKRPGDVQLLDPTGTIFPCSHGRGINERGDVVGAFSIVNTLADCNARPPAHGFVWHQGGFDIIDPPGAHDTFLFGINDDGIVVGVVTDRQGNVHGFEATPKN